MSSLPQSGSPCVKVAQSERIDGSRRAYYSEKVGNFMNNMVGFRLEEDVRDSFSIYCIQHKTSVQILLQEYVEKILREDKKDALK